MIPIYRIALVREGDKMNSSYDCASAIIEYEEGSLDYNDVLLLFQHLVDTGLAWKLQGHYGRTARALLSSGEININGGSE